MDNAAVLAKISEDFPQVVVSSDQSLDQLHITVGLLGDTFSSFMRYLRDNPKLRYTLLSDITATDWTPRTPRFDLTYILYSVVNEHRLVLHLAVQEGQNVPSATKIWHSADWAEREVYDLMGIPFDGHPDLRRILTWDSFEGHPLRKDFPLCGHHDVNEFDFDTLHVDSAFSRETGESCEIQNVLE